MYFIRYTQLAIVISKLVFIWRGGGGGGTYTEKFRGLMINIGQFLCYCRTVALPMNSGYVAPRIPFT